ncbi:MAG TPA: hypothetical protein VLA22_10490 [Gaiellaceae bacterium]|nr:hypothetical protein [Gaiellaceae bacterium]
MNDVAEVELEIEGASFVLRVFPDPSGLRGQVFRGEEKIAGVQIYHSTDVDLLIREARRNRAVLRAARDG